MPHHIENGDNVGSQPDCLRQIIKVEVYTREVI